MPDAMPDQNTPHDPPQESLWMRLLWMIIIGLLLGLAQTVVQMAALVQFVLMMTRGGRPNVELAWFGKRLGDWSAKAIRYQTAADDEKPWPWTPLD